MRQFIKLCLVLFVFFASPLIFAETVTNKSGVQLSSGLLPLTDSGAVISKKNTLAEISSHTYFFNAKKGQRVWVQLSSKNDQIGFAVRGIHNQELGVAGGADRSWQGNLPDTGEYSVVVYSNDGSKGNYILNAQFK